MPRKYVPLGKDWEKNPGKYGLTRVKRGPPGGKLTPAMRRAGWKSVKWSSVARGDRKLRKKERQRALLGVGLFAGGIVLLGVLIARASKTA